eukprot:g2876.t1
MARSQGEGEDPPDDATAGLVAPYRQDGPEAVRIAKRIPYYPFHGIERFYDISGMLASPEIFQLCVDIFVQRYRDEKSHELDCVFGIDARGFVLGPPIALALKKPFIMLRKRGKLPNAISGEEYFKEYASVDVVAPVPTGTTVETDSTGEKAAGGTPAGDELCMPRTAFDFFHEKLEKQCDHLDDEQKQKRFAETKPRCLIIDDLVATGGTLVAACDLVAKAGGHIVECGCVVELRALEGYKKLQKAHTGVEVWALISEAVLTTKGEENQVPAWRCKH